MMPKQPYSADDVAGNLADVKTRIDAVMLAQGLDRPRPLIIAVSKRQSADHIRRALEAGHRHFGENKVQEAQDKWPALLRDYPDARLHLIGHLQSNKAADAVALFDVIESLDRPKLAHAIAKALGQHNKQPSLFIQVNTGDEPQKSGVALDELDDFIALCRDDLELPITGLMCLPPVDDDPALHFALLAKLAQRHHLPQLSMGMSGDFELAALMGASQVRVGTAIFGPRPD
ncbi:MULTISPECIES: YggS family pyridoxal phosphate-dependent enzyme [unclassified Iodidimonas]|uniref:YggS family pyridoxal phosphate-dependent enzyme n=1 Tax=unclassified Iodidimonas TaxID=2626145 RepID=UPI002482DCA7|nr:MULTISPECIES: YggS family pyridoxal phosphate-dependent enzyme [unclassified Iodidimonas]